MYSNMILSIAILLLFFSLILILILIVKYINKREKGSLQFQIKCGFLEFNVNASGEKVIKKRK